MYIYIYIYKYILYTRSLGEYVFGLKVLVPFGPRVIPRVYIYVGIYIYKGEPGMETVFLLHLPFVSRLLRMLKLGLDSWHSFQPTIGHLISLALCICRGGNRQLKSETAGLDSRGLRNGPPHRGRRDSERWWKKVKDGEDGEDGDDIFSVRATIIIININIYNKSSVYLNIPAYQQTEGSPFCYTTPNHNHIDGHHCH